MRLYLCSYRLSGDTSALLRLVGDGRRAGIVLNASDAFGDHLYLWPRESADLQALGFDVAEVDLRDHFGDPGGLRERLAALDLLWVTGGNTFVLARAMNACGFVDAFDRDRTTYAGYSAGVCVLAPDLDGIHLMDDPDVVPERYPADVRPQPLGWLPWRVVPHWRSDHAETDAADLAVAHLSRAGLPFRTLRDGEAIVVEG